MKSQKNKVLDFSKNPLAIISEEVKRILKYKKSGSVLDLGTGGGRNALYLAKKGFGVTALDSVKNNLVKLKEVAKKQNVKLKLKHADILDFNPKQKYDIVLAISSLHFLKSSRVPNIIKRIKEYTKIGGLNVITVHTKKNIKKSHHRPHLFEKNELKDYYKDWEVLEYKEELGHWFKTEYMSKPTRKHKAELIARKSSQS